MPQVMGPSWPFCVEMTFTSHLYLQDKVQEPVFIMCLSVFSPHLEKGGGRAQPLTDITHYFL